MTKLEGSESCPFLPQLLERAQRGIEGKLKPILREKRLTYRGLTVLKYLLHYEGVNQETAALEVGINRNGMVIILNDLEAKGMVERRTNCLNRREHKLFLTEAGRRIAQDALARVNRLCDPVVRQLSEEQRRVVLDWLAALGVPGR